MSPPRLQDRPKLQSMKTNRVLKAPVCIGLDPRKIDQAVKLAKAGNIKSLSKYVDRALTNQMREDQKTLDQLREDLRDGTKVGGTALLP